MKKIAFSLLFVSVSNFALAGGPQVKFFTEKHGSMESSPARDAVIDEIKSGTPLGNCYAVFFREVQEQLAKDHVNCKLRMMNMPLTIEVTFFESNSNKVSVRVPELKLEDIRELKGNGAKFEYWICNNMANQAISAITEGKVFPFAKNYTPAIIDDIFSSAGNGSFFDERKCK